MTEDHKDCFKSALSPARLPVQVPIMQLPEPAIDLYRWAVIACDQHTTDPEYWRETAALVGDQPSALNLVLPEIYLEREGAAKINARIAAINSAMRQACMQKQVRPLPQGCIVLDRQTTHHASRKGLMLTVDLEAYDHHPKTTKPIRASEGTVMERIPPRMAIREDALLELPHIQLLFSDPQDRLMTSLWAHVQAEKNPPLYDTSLMQGGGHVRGFFLPASDPYLSSFLQGLADLPSFCEDGLLFAVGDGNHSLATAKAHWEKLKSQGIDDHPARYALVEIMNLHDPGLSFQPIHRVVYTQPAADVVAAAKTFFADQKLSVQEVPRPQKILSPQRSAQTQSFTVTGPNQVFHLTLRQPQNTLTAGSVQAFLDDQIEQEDWQIDYVHGQDSIVSLCDQGHAGILLPALSKQDFFPLLAKNGVLPRKTFSLGEACEKRYYIESRRIR